MYIYPHVPFFQWWKKVHIDIKGAIERIPDFAARPSSCIGRLFPLCGGDGWFGEGGDASFSPTSPPTLAGVNGCLWCILMLQPKGLRLNESEIILSGGSDAAVNIQMSHHGWMVWAITASSFTCLFSCAAMGRLQSSVSFPRRPQKSATHRRHKSCTGRASSQRSPRCLIHLPVCHFNSYFYGCSVLIGLLPQHDNSRPGESLTKGARPDIKRIWTTPQISPSQKGIHTVT